MKIIAICIIILGIGLLIYSYYPRYSIHVRGKGFNDIDKAMEYARVGDTVKLNVGTHNWGINKIEDKD